MSACFLQKRHHIKELREHQRASNKSRPFAQTFVASRHIPFLVFFFFVSSPSFPSSLYLTLSQSRKGPATFHLFHLVLIGTLSGHRAPRMLDRAISPTSLTYLHEAQAQLPILKRSPFAKSRPRTQATATTPQCPTSTTATNHTRPLRVNSS